MDFTAQELRVEVTNPATSVLSLSLPAGSLSPAETARARGSTRTPPARREGGIFKARPGCDALSCQLSLKAFGSFDAATVPDMTTHVYLARSGWTVRANWDKRPKGWRLNGRTELLPPL
jgi:hypothetical protein